MKPLMVDSSDKPDYDVESSTPNNAIGLMCAKTMEENPEFWAQGGKFLFCFFGLQISYLTWGFMQELIMTSVFEPTEHAPDGRFPSAQFCVFSNRFLALAVALIAVKLKH